MPIETICLGCGNKLRVPDEHAGKKARCPQCKTIYLVPSNTPPDLLQNPAGQAAEPERWLLITPTGQTYGPVPKRELDSWVEEGRVTARHFVRTESASVASPAANVYPSLRPTVRENPSYRPRGETSRSDPRPFGRPLFRQPHRGGTILVCGILGVVGCCFLFAIAAWVMGSKDLNAMNRGLMDPRGRGTTQVGMVLGIVGTLWQVCALFPFVLL